MFTCSSNFYTLAILHSFNDIKIYLHIYCITHHDDDNRDKHTVKADVVFHLFIHFQLIFEEIT